MNQQFAQAVQRFIQHIRQRYPTSSTATHYQSDLEQFGSMVDKAPRAVTRADVGHFVTVQLAQGLSAATVNRRLATLSSFFEFLADEANDDYWANPVVWRSHRVRQGRHLPRDLSEAVARQFWQAVHLGPVRDRAIVALMLDVGLRVSEVAALRVQDFEPAPYPGELPSLRVRGKGDKERRVWLAPETAAVVQSWLAERPAVADEALFITRRKRGFTVRGIQDRVKHYARRAGLQPDQVSCHRLRHTFARRMAEARMPLPSLSHWLGHSQLKTTQVYIDGANPDVQADYQAAMARLSEPFDELRTSPAECQDIRTLPSPESVVETTPSSEPQSSPDATTPPSLRQAQDTALTATDIERMASGLPAWLLSHMVAFLLAKQVRWQPLHRRARARQWLGELRRAWTWLLDQRQVTSLASLSRSDLSAYLAHCHERELSNGTINHFLSTFWAFLKFVEDRGETIAPGLYRVPRPKQPDWQPRPLSEAEYARLEQAVLTTTAKDTPEAAALDLSWFFILSDGGLRISELLTLTVGDWDPQTQTLHIRYGKDGHERRVPVTARTAQAIEAHLAGRHAERQVPLLIRQGRAVSADYIRQRLHALAAQAQVEGVTPHRLRHTYATRLLNGGGLSITTLQKLMGHRRLDTTMLYTKVYDQTIQDDYAAAMARLQARSESSLDWDLWGPTLEAIFQTEAETTAVPKLSTITNCM
jgi:site-specific recombinase XerD